MLTPKALQIPYCAIYFSHSHHVRRPLYCILGGMVIHWLAFVSMGILPNKLLYQTSDAVV